MDLQLTVVYIILCFALFLCRVSSHHVAVIIGGTNSGNDLKDVEVYSDDKGSICHDTGNPAQVPNFPHSIKGGSGVFIPDKGIYICGGVMATGEMDRKCYKYNPAKYNR